MSFSQRIALLGAVWVTIAVSSPGASIAQSYQDADTLSLSLEAALERAMGQSEALIIARAGVDAARGDKVSARAGWFPQVSTSLSYSRTLVNQFSGSMGSGGGSAAEPCSSFTPDSSVPLSERVGLLERAIGCSAESFGGIDLGQAGFGAANSYNVGLSLSQTLFDGGRIGAQNRIADAGVRSAELEVTAQDAELAVTVAERYYDALLGERLLEIAEASLAQAEETLRLSEIAFGVGDKAEYDVLRARVARNNQRNAVVQQRSARDLAMIALKQQLDLPLDEPIRLTTALSDETPPEVLLPEWVSDSAADTTTDARVPVRQAIESVRVQEEQVRASEAESLPNVSLTSSYGLVAYPQDLLPKANNFRDNWSVGLSISFLLFDGGRIRGAAVQSQSALEQARARLQQTREQAALDARTKQFSVRAARSAWEATAGTVEEARQAYRIAQLRYQQGLSSLTEVNDSRLALSQSEADRAHAARDLYVAQMQALLVRDLPLSGSAAATTTNPADGSSMTTQSPTTTQSSATAASQASSGGPTGMGGLNEGLDS